ncbi:hypothetical protein DFH28DRAFT_60476 [Melampsora americana]|nr:hypothetical protein DFH28DRAFT_60476 [Melampsora americana]
MRMSSITSWSLISTLALLRFHLESFWSVCGFLRVRKNTRMNFPPVSSLDLMFIFSVEIQPCTSVLLTKATITSMSII